MNIESPLTLNVISRRMKNYFEIRKRKFSKTFLTIENAYANKFINITLYSPEKYYIHLIIQVNFDSTHAIHSTHVLLEVLQGLCVQSQSRNGVRADAGTLRQV